MRFQGLPVEMHVGRADLTPVSPCSLLTECTFCNDVSPSFMVCVNNHTICQACSVSSPPPGTSTWCPVCAKIVTATAVYIELDMLSQIQFRCHCSFEGTLPQIKLHILKDGMHQGFPRVTEGESEPLALPKISHASEGPVQNTIADTIQKFEHRAERDMEGTKSLRIREMTPIIKKNNDIHKKDLMQVIDEARNGLLQQVRDLLQKGTVDLEAKIEASKDLIFSMGKLATSPIGYLWFNIAKLGTPLQTGPTGVSSEVQRTNVAGLPMEVYVKVETVRDEQYLNAYGGIVQIAGVNLPLPLKRKIILGVHDEYGRMVSSEAYNSYDATTERYYFGCGLTEQDRKYSGTKHLALLSSLHSEDCLVEGKVCISVELQPMDT